MHPSDLSAGDMGHHHHVAAKQASCARLLRQASMDARGSAVGAAPTALNNHSIESSAGWLDWTGLGKADPRAGCQTPAPKAAQTPLKTRLSASLSASLARRMLGMLEHTE